MYSRSRALIIHVSGRMSHATRKDSDKKTKRRRQNCGPNRHYQRRVLLLLLRTVGTCAGTVFWVPGTQAGCMLMSRDGPDCSLARMMRLTRVRTAHTRTAVAVGRKNLGHTERTEFERCGNIPQNKVCGILFKGLKLEKIRYITTTLNASR